ncbi:MAG TPA: CoA-binding protein, partial [Anaerolineae bacterium]|nr:CoA-binding protein [Anaerolineae bacterium]
MSLPNTATLKPNLAPLLRARSVAIVGISQPGRFGGRVYANLRDFGYTGQIYGVNPRYNSLYDQPCYPSLSDLPDRPDCAILAVPNQRLLEALQDTAALSIPAAVIFASAFLEQAKATLKGADAEPKAPYGQAEAEEKRISLQDQLAQMARA